MAMSVKYAADEAHGTTALRINKVQRLAVITFVASFALDFKGATGGSFGQLLMSGLNAAAFILLAMSYRMALPKRGLAAIIVWAWLAFLLVGTLGAIANSTPVGQYVRVLHPFALFLMGFLVVWWTARNPWGACLIVSAMMTAAVISLFFTLWWGLYFTGTGLDQIRYQILSPLIPLLIVVSGYDLFFARQQRVWSIMLLVIIISLIALSVTRGPVLAAGLVAGLVLLVALVNAARSGSVPRPIQSAFIWGLSLSVVGVLVAIFFYPEVAGRWTHRALGGTQNITFWIRAAAVVGQYEALASSWHGWFIGQGFGSSYPWPVSVFPWITPYVGNEVDRLVWFPGEFMWMPFLYYGGLICGTIVASVLILGTLRGIRVLGILLRGHLWRMPQLRPLWIGVLGYFAFLAIGLSANPFIFRLAALFMGMCLALIVAQSRTLSDAVPVTRARKS